MKMSLMWLLLPLAIVVVSISPATFAQESTVSLDNLWDDEASKSTAPVPSLTHPSSAPMCGFQAFQGSYLVEKGGWTGVGPFKPGDGGPYELVDPQLNHLKLSVADEKITQVELSLTKEKPGKEDFLDLQMAGSFLLEAVGAKAKKVADFTTEMEKNKEAILYQSGTHPVNLEAGHYLIAIKRKVTDNPDRFQYVFRVSSRDASPDAIKEHSVAQGGKNSQEAGTGNANKVLVDGKIASVVTATNDPALKQEFLAVIQNWQKVKKTVTRQRQASELSNVLSGRALAVQTDSVKKLLSSHKYWEINPKGVAVDRYIEQVAGQKYQVLAQVKQSKKYVDEITGQVLKEDDDSDKVSYTMEKIGNQWFITDYSIISSTPQAVKSGPGKASK